MLKSILETLVTDADLVANVGIRLGRLQGTDLLTALGNARTAVEANSATPEIVAQLQTSLNIAVRELAPITLFDLRSGWTPFETHRQQRIGTIVFGGFSLLLIVAAAYLTQIYDRSRSLFDTTVEYNIVVADPTLVDEGFCHHCSEVSVADIDLRTTK